MLGKMFGGRRSGKAEAKDEGRAEEAKDGAGAKAAAKDGSDISIVAIIGAGFLGSVAAGELALCGVKVMLCDRSPARLDAVKAEIHGKLQQMREQDLISAEDEARIDSYITCTPETDEAVCNADLVIEMIVEDAAIKRSVFAEVAKFSKPSAILASSTLSLNLDQIAQGLPNPDQFCGCRFLYPAFLIDYVELTRSSSTSDATHNRMKTFFDSIHKRCFPGPNSQLLAAGQVKMLQMLSKRRRMARALGDGARDSSDGVKDGAAFKATAPRMQYYAPVPDAFKVLEQLSEDTEIPHEYLCPITQGVMMDPVTAPDNKNYERSALTIWLQRKATSPMTNLPFAKNAAGKVDLVANTKLREEIGKYVAKLEMECL